ncbi:hypothetical protein NL676_007642 [Syzygium grande]|nr:hypothetical protein NL676_007642 [Syzygium grande]
MMASCSDSCMDRTNRNSNYDTEDKHTARPSYTPVGNPAPVEGEWVEDVVLEGMDPLYLDSVFAPLCLALGGIMSMPRMISPPLQHIFCRTSGLQRTTVIVTVSCFWLKVRENIG